MAESPGREEMKGESGSTKRCGEQPVYGGRTTEGCWLEEGHNGWHMAYTGAGVSAWPSGREVASRD